VSVWSAFSTHSPRHVCNWAVAHKRTHNLACKNLCTPIFASYCDCDGFWNFFLPFFPIFCGALSCIVFDPGDHFFFCSTNYSVYRLTGNWSNSLKNLNFLAMQIFKINNIFKKNLYIALENGFNFQLNNQPF